MRSLFHKEGGLFDDMMAHTPYSIKTDAFDVEYFQTLKAHSKRLLQTEAAGTKEYPQFMELQQDMFGALFKYGPELNERAEIKREFLLNRKVMEHMLESQRYKELRVMTKSDLINSTFGVEVLSEEAMRLVKEFKREREALQAAVDAANQAAALQARLNGQGADGRAMPPLNPEEEAQSRMELEEAEQKYEEAMEEFEELTERKDFQQQVEEMLTQVQDTVRETTEDIANWGLERSESFQKKSPHEKMALLNKLRGSDKLRDIARMTGRCRQLYHTHKKEKVKVGMDSHYSVEQGNDLSRIIASELMRLLNKRTRLQFYSDFLEGKTLQYQIPGKQKKGKGPIVICIDSSGSMSGLPEIWAKAVALVLLEIAREQKRDFFCIHFSSGWRGEKLHTNYFPKNDPFDGEQLLDLAEYFEAGGTEFEPPLDLAREKIGKEPIWEKADIIFCTDGESVVRDEWLKGFMEWKAANKVSIFSVLIDSYDNSQATLRKFSDRVDKLSKLRNDAGNDNLALDIFLDI
jgi:uncharacterized protein with von Willebrand factor type A (vWA) domain